MSNIKIQSGKVKKIPSTEVSSERYDFISLGEVEPDLGVSLANGNVLTTNTDGTRIWVSPEKIVLDSKVASLMPYLINANETYVVPANTQALFSLPLEINGTLEVDGILVQV
jgi:hypothetical protein